jgi:hypothetical protein
MRLYYSVCREALSFSFLAFSGYNYVTKFRYLNTYLLPNNDYLTNHLGISRTLYNLMAICSGFIDLGTGEIKYPFNLLLEIVF